MGSIKFNNVIENISELPFYRSIVAKIINYLRINHRARLSEIIKYVEGGDRRTLRLLNEMVKAGLVQFKNGYFSVPRAPRYSIPSQDVVCHNCQGKIVNSRHHLFVKIKKIMKKIYSLRPLPTFIFDQRPVTLDTTLRRAFYLVWRGDLQDKRIALVGDDDLTSLVLGFLGLAKEMVVFEIDKRWVKFIKQQAIKYKLNIKVVEKNILNGLPRQYKQCFDVFLADPTPTAIPFTAFVNTGLKLLKPGVGRTGYLSFYPSCMAKTMDLQKILTRMNLMITDSLPFFTEYEIIPHTYRPADELLFKKYNAGFLKTAFFEYLVRVETTALSRPKTLKITTADIIGRATKRACKNPTKDPAAKTNSPYLKMAMKNLLKNKNKKIFI